MLLHTTSKKIEVHYLTISNYEGPFKVNADMQKVEQYQIQSTRHCFNLTVILEEW